MAAKAPKRKTPAKKMKSRRQNARPSADANPRTRPRTRARVDCIKGKRRSAKAAAVLSPVDAERLEMQVAELRAETLKYRAQAEALKVRPISSNQHSQRLIEPRKEPPTPEQLEKFLEGIRGGLTNNEATAYAGTTWGQLSYLMCYDTKFNADFLEAKAQLAHTLKAEHDDNVRLRANGWMEPIYQGGQLVGHRERFSEKAMGMMAHKTSPGEYIPLPASAQPKAAPLFGNGLRVVIDEEPEEKAEKGPA